MNQPIHVLYVLPTLEFGGIETIVLRNIQAMDKARFRKPVVPGDQIEFHVTKIKQRGNIWKFHCDAMVSGVKVAEADVGAMLAEQEGDA